MADTTTTDGATGVECDKCGYVWDYSGQLARATCPSCGHKVPVREPITVDESG